MIRCRKHVERNAKEMHAFVVFHDSVYISSAVSHNRNQESQLEMLSFKTQKALSLLYIRGIILSGLSPVSKF